MSFLPLPLPLPRGRGMLVSFRLLDMRYVHGDSDTGPVAPREEPFAANFATDRPPGQREGHIRERYRMKLALDLALPSRFRLRRCVLQRAIDGGNARGGVSERVALCEGGVEREPVLPRHVV